MMSDALLRALLRDRVISRGSDWLRQVLAAAGTDRISDLSRERLLLAIDERDAG
jgi:hypothetical protein